MSISLKTVETAERILPTVLGDALKVVEQVEQRDGSLAEAGTALIPHSGLTDITLEGEHTRNTTYYVPKWTEVMGHMFSHQKPIVTLKLAPGITLAWLEDLVKKGRTSVRIEPPRNLVGGLGKIGRDFAENFREGVSVIAPEVRNAVQELIQTERFRQSTLQEKLDMVSAHLNSLDSIGTLVNSSDIRGFATDSIFRTCNRMGEGVSFARQLNFSDAEDIKKPNAFSLKLVIESLGVGPTKIAQILADDPAIPGELRLILNEVKSKGIPTYTTEGAQTRLDALLKVDGSAQRQYVILKNIGTGSVGETWLARDLRSGKHVAVKLLKNGVTEDSLRHEQKTFHELINMFMSKHPKEEWLHEWIDGLYNGWHEELDFGREAENAIKLAKSTEHAHVIAPLTIGYENGVGKAIVYELAEGHSLNTLIKMLDTYHTEGLAAYLEKYADILQENPELSDPEKWKQQLVDQYLHMSRMHFMMPTSGVKTIHGDFHDGNIFVKINPQTFQPYLTLIDPGLVADMDRNEMIRKLGFNLDFMTGNSKGIAKRLLHEAGINSQDSSYQEMIKTIAADLDTMLFQSGYKVLDGNYTMGTIDKALERWGVRLKQEGSLVYTKSQIQSKLTGMRLAQAARVKESNPNGGTNDFKAALGGASRLNPFLTVQQTVPALGFVIAHPGEAIPVATQFLSPGI